MSLDFKLKGIELKKIDKSLLTKTMKRISLFVFQSIQSKTKSGLDADGKQFKQYSESYKKFKKSQFPGRNVSRVDLTLSGQMLKSLQTTVIKKGNSLQAKVFFSNSNTAGFAYRYKRKTNRKRRVSTLAPNKKAFFIEANGREFVGVSKKEIAKIVNLVQNDIIRAIKI